MFPQDLKLKMLSILLHNDLINLINQKSEPEDLSSGSFLCKLMNQFKVKFSLHLY